jgi:hypothetical protein
VQLATFSIDPAEARTRLAEYQAQLKTERTAQDEAIAMGYRAAARGMPVISLSRTVAAGGYHRNGLPRIAVVRADARECFVRWGSYGSGDLVFADYDSWRANRGALVGVHTVRVPVDNRPLVVPSSWYAASTIVPLIPPRHRPRLRRLRHCHVLWEVEAWERVPPRDPALLRHIRGDLWAVLACWDLSDLERAVLAM